MHGKGKFYYSDGRYYEGRWKYDEKHGEGCEYYSDGKLKYKGEYNNNKREGYGIFKDKEFIQIGHWKNDKMIKGEELECEKCLIWTIESNDPNDTRNAKTITKEELGQIDKKLEDNEVLYTLCQKQINTFSIIEKK